MSHFIQFGVMFR